MYHKSRKSTQKLRRRRRISNKVHRVSSRPRLCVFRSLKHMYAQVIDDAQGRTLASASTLDEGIKGMVAKGGNVGAAQAVGKVLAERALAAGVTEVCFDRREFKYHGRIAALADAAREGGLQF
ncbi:MAG: 50S ribosomal protein L18 [Pirellulales bacterium]|nr:50S ribosomal protein L18 [Pirellulales bacterium]